MDNYYFTSAYSLLVGNLVNGRATEFVEISSLSDAPTQQSQAQIQNENTSQVMESSQPTESERNLNRGEQSTQPRQPLQTPRDVVGSGMSSRGGY